MTVRGHLLRGAILGSVLFSGPALAQLYGFCGFGAGTITGDLEVPEADIEGAIVLDGTIDLSLIHI